MPYLPVSNRSSFLHQEIPAAKQERDFGTFYIWLLLPPESAIHPVVLAKEQITRAIKHSEIQLQAIRTQDIKVSIENSGGNSGSLTIAFRSIPINSYYLKSACLMSAEDGRIGNRGCQGMSRELVRFVSFFSYCFIFFIYLLISFATVWAIWLGLLSFGSCSRQI